MLCVSCQCGHCGPSCASIIFDWTQLNFLWSQTFSPACKMRSFLAWKLLRRWRFCSQLYPFLERQWEGSICHMKPTFIPWWLLHIYIIINSILAVIYLTKYFFYIYNLDLRGRASFAPRKKYSFFWIQKRAAWNDTYNTIHIR